LIQELEQQSQRIDTLATSLKNANSLNIGLSVISGLFLICLVLLFIKKKGGGSMSKDQFFKFFSFLKNPLWIIVILLIVTIYLLLDVSQKIEDYILYESNESNNGIRFYTPEYYDRQFGEIKDSLEIVKNSVWSISEKLADLDIKLDEVELQILKYCK